MSKRKNYLFEIVFLPIIIIAFTVTSITIYNIQMTKDYINRYIDEKEIEFLDEQKLNIYNKVQLVNDLIKINSQKLETKLLQTLTEKLETSLRIAESVYTNNQHLPKNKIQKLLGNRLSLLKFNKNRGYYFILDEENILIEHALEKYIGQDMTGFVDASGNNVIKQYKKSLESNSMGLVKHYFYKPDNPLQQSLKLTAVTYYAPLDIMIGTGEYLDVAVQEMKTAIIEQLTNDNDLNRYIFVLDLHTIDGGKEYATMLVNNNRKDLVGKFVDDSVVDIKGTAYQKEYLKGLRLKGDSFINYYFKKPNSEDEKEKLSYFYWNKEWNWIIGSGFYFEDLDNEIARISDETNDYLDDMVSNSIFWVLVFSVLTGLASSVIFYQVKKSITRTTNRLLKSRENLNRAQHIAKIGSWDLDLKTNALYWSDEIYNIFEKSHSDFKPSYAGFLDAIHPDDQEMVNNTFNDAIKNRISYRLTHRLLMYDGRVKWVEEQGTIKYDDTGDATIAHGIVCDITEKYAKDRKIEEQTQLLFHQNKMAAMGEMIENIAHQWRQPLSAISTSASGIKIEKEFGLLTDEKAINRIDDILETTEYLSSTIDDFRNFFNKNKERDICKLEDIYNNSMKLVGSKLHSLDIEVIESIESIQCTVFKNELIQCLLNILNNAQDALLKRQDGKRRVFVDIYSKDNSAYIVIKDNAGGIPTDILPKIFEPYFTTKHQSQGTGIGLYMVEEIIVKHLKGQITVRNTTYKWENNEYTGAEFKIILPYD